MSLYFLAAMLVLAGFAPAFRGFGRVAFDAGFVAAFFAVVASPR
jgi:hypothetical protein